jgi:hypothetical protein
MLKNLWFNAALLGGAFGILMVSGVARAQNLLSNPDLDVTSVSSQVLATPTGWTAVANKTISGPFNDGMSSEGFCNVQQAGGTGLFFKPFQGNATTGDKISASLYQDNPGTAGLKYVLTGWAGAGAGYIGLADPTVKSEFHIDFLDSSSTVIGGATLDLRLAGLGTPNGNPFGYANYMLMATAPAGTALVRSRATMTDAYGNPAGGDQAFVVDAFTLTVPEPATLGLASLGGLMLLVRRRIVNAA